MDDTTTNLINQEVIKYIPLKNKINQSLRLAPNPHNSFETMWSLYVDEWWVRHLDKYETLLVDSAIAECLKCYRG